MKIFDKESLKKVLSNAIPLLCQSGLPKQTSFRIDAMIGITIDTSQTSTLICFSESIGPNNQPNILSLVHNNSDTLNNNNHYDNGNYNNTYEDENPVIENYIPNEDKDEDVDCTFPNNIKDANNNVESDNKVELNNIDHTNNHNIDSPVTNTQATINRKRPRKSKPYSNSQLNSFDQQQDNNITIKQEVDDRFTSYPPDNNFGQDNNNNFEENNSNNFEEVNKLYVEDKITMEWNQNESDGNNTQQNTTNLLNNNQQYPINNSDTYQNNPLDKYQTNDVEHNTNNITDNYLNNNNSENYPNNNNYTNNNVDEFLNINNNNVEDHVGWIDNNNSTTTLKKCKKQRPSKKFTDSLPLEASSYLEQQQQQHLSSTTATIATTDLINNLANTPTPNNDVDYNNLMQGICEFVMSQSQRINDKSRPQSRTCHICQATLSNPLSLKNHIQGTHLALKLRRCNLCGETFKWTMQLARHKKRMHGGGDFVNIYNVT